MKSRILISFTMIVVIISTPLLYAGDDGHVQPLHTNDRWKECSFVLDPSLTQKDWHQFAREAGLVVYYRPMASAKPMGVGNIELAITNMSSFIDDRDDAWNDTFSHPDSTHWLFAGGALGFPGMAARAGITEKIDVGIYFTKNPNANYGIYGGQLQYNLLNDLTTGMAVAIRASFVRLFGPEDLNLGIYGLDLIVSGDVSRYSPYAGISTYLSSVQETTSKVNLDDESVTGLQGMAGVATNFSHLRLSVEMHFASVNTTSFLIGYGF